MLGGREITDQLGNGGTSDAKNYPVLVVDGQNSTSALANIVQIGSGTNFSCALTESGGVRCWGSGIYGRLGNNNIYSPSKSYPVAVLDSAGASASAISGIFQIALARNHACALKNDGEVICWGNGSGGILGNDETADKPHAVTVIDGDGSSTALDVGTPTFSRYACNSYNGATSCATE